MKLISAKVSNFRRIHDGEFVFSTDPTRPLTIVRAENGMGKTTLLLALSWVLFGDYAIPNDDAAKRLIDADSPIGSPITVHVTVIFEHEDSGGNVNEYQLDRWITQTRTGPQAHEITNGAGGATLSRRKPGRGSEFEPIDEAALAKFLPRQHMRLFFTDGENVEHFIAGSKELKTARQAQVHDSIRSLLPIEDVEKAERNVDAVMKKLRQAASKAAGSEVEEAANDLEQAEKDLAELEKDRDACEGRIVLMTTQRDEWEGRLEEIRTNGDLEVIQKQLRLVDERLRDLQHVQEQALVSLRDLMRDEGISWGCIEDYLNAGMKVLDDLELKGIIPGLSIEVLRDRLDIGVCICGEGLATGDEHTQHRRDHIEELLKTHSDISPERNSLTELMHITRQARRRQRQRAEEQLDVFTTKESLLEDYADAREKIAEQSAERKRLEEQRALIDEEEVQQLTQRIAKVKEDLGEETLKLGSLRVRVEHADTVRATKEALHEEQKRNQNQDARLEAELLVAQDMQRVLRSVLNTLKTDTVRRVANQMSEVFLKIVGSDGAGGASVIAGASIDENTFDIKVTTQAGSYLDPNHELNGASKRALTLAFIWSLMELSGTEAPRIIDTPLGMVSGNVKRRMVEEMTQEPAEDASLSQIVLFLTRSEIRDIEDLLEARAGAVQSMTCPTDSVTLAYPISSSAVQVCQCGIRSSCEICALTNDADYGISRQQGGQHG